MKWSKRYTLDFNRRQACIEVVFRHNFLFQQKAQLFPFPIHFTLKKRESSSF